MKKVFRLTTTMEEKLFSKFNACVVFSKLQKLTEKLSIILNQSLANFDSQSVKVLSMRRANKIKTTFYIKGLD